MDTWKNNNVLTRIKESYFLEDTDRDGASGLPSDVKLVGGTIFYIDNTADGIYEFFDADGNQIKKVKIGDRPYYYRVVKKDPADKYYVYHDEVYDGSRWNYRKGRWDVYGALNTSEGIRSGKANTEKVMSKDSGAYITRDSRGLPTIWYQLQQVRNAKAGNCDDWFVPSKDEIEKLRLAVKSGGVSGGTIAGSSYEESIFKKRNIWSSSEYSDQFAWIWDYGYQNWYYSSMNTSYSVFFARAF